MKTSRYLQFFLVAGACLVFGAASAQAQATRTWVSGVGDDVNPCSRTAPCKTFAGAISKTATGGEISVLDPGGYGTLTITKAITVDGGTGAGWGSTLFSSVNGFVINITTNLSTDKVILRNLSLNGAGTTLGVDGIRFLDGQELTVENVDIQRFSGDGIEVNQAQGANVFIRNVSINVGTIGIKMTGAGGIGGSISESRISGMGSHAIQATTNIFMLVRNVTIDRPGGTGVRVDGASTLNCEGVIVQGANIGFETVANASATIRLANSATYNNNTGIATTAGTVASAGGNRNAGNGTPGAPNAAVTVQ